MKKEKREEVISTSIIDRIRKEHFDIQVYYVGFPESVRGASRLVKDKPDHFEVFINQRLPEEEQLKVFLHEMIHCYRNDFSGSREIQELEADTHRIIEELTAE